MHANKNCVNNFVGDVDVDVDLHPFLLRYKDGRVERLLRSPFVPASENPTANRGVATRDVVIDPGTGVSARLFLPSRAAMAAGGGRRRLPLVVYVHGGSFCTESAFCRTYHRYATSLAAAAGALVVSVEYRLAPEHPIPTAYDDAWSALRWAASHADSWLADHADPGRTFLAGDSAGGNIVYHTAVRASRDGVGIEGVVIVQPYLWGAERLPSEAACGDGAAVLPAYGVDRLWPFVTAGQAGNEDPRLNPPDEEIASLTCRRFLVAVAEKDTLSERGRRLFGRIRDYYAVAGGEATLVESEGEDHGFHLYSPLRATSRRLMQSIVRFINQPPAPAPDMNGGLHWHAWAEEGKKINRASTMTTTPEHVILGVPSRPFRDLFGYGMDMKQHYGSTTTCMAYGGTSRIGGHGKAGASKANYGLFTARPNKAYKGPSAAAAALPGTYVIKNF
ncbi:hypothetical protein SEVIR_2G025400v4 [Setaria viridis]|uniref:Alpha/beta hydrolase fold-3 domain-containing protein n=2 Tax=Setaria TaxID=4554 RepID=K3ZZV0_SETIT|nr:probable carboxylesterase 13 [Setaria italica]XP_034582900.1 probable carboxylesterase 13 [Setaria viridis]RCV09353.1 hypothetical protein SETIT_2G020800v2 [Setaria italica]TKW30276.1 hypothetical protein SEVIR_2G025400v2 [Setaria viridis]